MMSDSYGAPQADGLLPSVEPVPVSPLRAAIPRSLSDDRMALSRLQKLVARQRVRLQLRHPQGHPRIMTTEPTPLVTVLPCDRLAAAALIEWQQAATREWKRPDGDEQWQFFHSAFPADIRKGIWDEHDVVQAFARHRLAALEEGREQAAGLAEMGDWDSWSALATAIRALSNKGGRDGE